MSKFNEIIKQDKVTGEVFIETWPDKWQARAERHAAQPMYFPRPVTPKEIHAMKGPRYQTVPHIGWMYSPLGHTYAIERDGEVVHAEIYRRGYGEYYNGRWTNSKCEKICGIVSLEEVNAKCLPNGNWPIDPPERIPVIDVRALHRHEVAYKQHQIAEVFHAVRVTSQDMSRTAAGAVA